MKLSRKEFLQLSVVFLGGSLVGCSDGGSTSGSDLSQSGTTPDLSNPRDMSSSNPSDLSSSGNCLQNGTATAIANNHGHVLMVPVSDIQAGTDKTYSIMGSAGHTHDVMLTAANFADLAANKPVSTVSTTTLSHMHAVMISCA